MSNIWQRDYDKLLKGKKPHTWYPWIVQNGTWDRCEISVCNTDYPHGFLSYGWFGPNEKILIYENHEKGYNKAHTKELKTLFMLMWSRAEAFAEVLNKVVAEKL